MVPVISDWAELLRVCAKPHLGDRAWVTLCYLFYHMRCGIFCEIRNHRVLTFQPFANAKFRNRWRLRFAGGSLRRFLESYAETVKRRDAVLTNTREWWANGGLLCNVRGRAVWGQAHFQELLESVRRVAPRTGDGVFFLNKRDSPVLRCDRRDVYSALYAQDTSILDSRHEWVRVCSARVEVHPDLRFSPIFSFYVDPTTYEDRPMPLSHEHALLAREEQVQLGRRRGMQEQSEQLPWRARRRVAFFRGSATGAGVTPDTNPRLRLAQMSYERRRNQNRHAHETSHVGGGHVPLDARLTHWNLRHKVGPDGVVRHLNPSSYPFQAHRSYFVPTHHQRRWRYHIYAPGNVGASRLSTMLLSGSLVLLVESELPQPGIYFHLVPWRHYVPVRSDLSDLDDVLRWVREHDEECRQICLRARAMALAHLQAFIRTWLDDVDDDMA